MKTKKTPQEKKEISYKKDRKNDYGENNKSSRKSIKYRKTWVNQTFRRGINQILTDTIKTEDGSEEANEKVNSVKRKPWKKQTDIPLGIYLKRKSKDKG
ncbi:MAG: hypothetical protein HY959_11205 [Ignavibacteriae bacterium]|nr:hypothetical protein [Ignavibacteriota bacterium]